MWYLLYTLLKWNEQQWYLIAMEFRVLWMSLKVYCKIFILKIKIYNTVGITLFDTMFKVRMKMFYWNISKGLHSFSKLFRGSNEEDLEDRLHLTRP